MAEGRQFDVRRHLPSMAFVVASAIVIAGVAGAFVFSGLYNIGADAPHSTIVTAALGQLRGRGHARHRAVRPSAPGPAP